VNEISLLFGYIFCSLLKLPLETKQTETLKMTRDGKDNTIHIRKIRDPQRVGNLAGALILHTSK